MITSEQYKEIWWEWKNNPTKENKDKLFWFIREAVKADFATIKERKGILFTPDLDDKITDTALSVLKSVMKHETPVDNIVSFSYRFCYKYLFGTAVRKQENEDAGLSYEEWSENKIIEMPEDKVIGMVSGGYDPLHEGHLKEIAFAKDNCDYLICVVMGDEWLEKKKRIKFENLVTRLSIMWSLKWIDKVVICNSDKQGTIIPALEEYKPDILFKGGDRNSPDKIPEAEYCKENGIEIMFTGDEKLNSSADILDDYYKRRLENDKRFNLSKMQ